MLTTTGIGAEVLEFAWFCEGISAIQARLDNCVYQSSNEKGPRTGRNKIRLMQLR